jgi:hypothetical protein
MNRLITAVILVILLSAAVLSSSEYSCEQHETGNNIVLTCLASKEVNAVVNKAVDSTSDAELLSRELSMMDEEFVKKLKDSKDIQSQVHAYLDDVRNGVQIRLSEKDIKRIVEEDITYEEFVKNYVRRD